MWIVISLALILSACSTFSAPPPVPPAGDLSRPQTTANEGKVVERPNRPPSQSQHPSVLNVYKLDDIQSMRTYYTKRDGKTPIDPSSQKELSKLSQECKFKAEQWRTQGEVFQNVNTTLIGKRPGFMGSAYCAIDTMTDSLAEKTCSDVGEELHQYDNRAHTVTCRAR
jgi:hypothetical protein